MSQIGLLRFQELASDQIIERYDRLAEDPRRPMQHREWAVPFYQALSAITGSGKTPILADAVAQLRARFAQEPIVLWMSMAKAVVDQTHANFSPGGKYAHLIEGYVVFSFSELNRDIVSDTSIPILATCTVGSFNRRGEGLRAHQNRPDTIGGILWNILRERTIPGVDGRRPLVIVYDEGHNLTDQQTELLLELEPDVVLVASATMRAPNSLGRLIQRLKDHGWTDDDFVTRVSSREAVEIGLVKEQVVLGGYNTVMEATVGEMLDHWRLVCRKAAEADAGFSPKAIYVCRTNISQDDGTPDNPARPFRERKAPPILIWRYLTERQGIDPAEIAVYCDLRLDRRNNPPPEDFILFSGGEDDFATFRAGNFRHIIFNLSLQEGWDDPEVCVAYIDKSMKTKIGIQQLIGRVIRQPGARRLQDLDLNTAQFFVRMDDRQEFPEVLSEVQQALGPDGRHIKVRSYFGGERQRMRQEPKFQSTVPEIHIDSDGALSYTDDGQPTGPFADALAEMHDYRRDRTNTVGKGEKMIAVHKVGDGQSSPVTTTELKHSNRVMARWIVRRGVQSLYPRVAQTIDWSNPKFDAKVEINSPAATSLRESAERLVQTYLQHSELAFEEGNPYVVGPMYANPTKLTYFEHAVHEGYSDLNDLEDKFARAIDQMGLTWARNPSGSGYAIPLLESGDSRNFYPDFLVWKDGIVFALDPKGDHLITRDAGLKLLDIRDERGRRRVVVRLFTEGKWTDPGTKVSDGGFTVWTIGQNSRLRPRHVTSVEQAVEAALRP